MVPEGGTRLLLRTVFPCSFASCVMNPIHRFTVLLVFVGIFALLLAGCGPRPTPSPTPVVPTPTIGPTPTPPPTAPRLLRTEPARGEELPPERPFVLTFDRPLDPGGVELRFAPPLEGETRVEGAKVLFRPARFLPGQRFRVQVEARAGGYSTGPLSLSLLMRGYLEVANTTPADGNDDVATDAPLTIAFNRPVVPLGASGEDPGLPQPLQLEPPAAGRGRWLNTSIYQFQPDPPLLAGVTYRATVDGVTDLTGSTLAAAYTFTFTTASPVVIQVQPEGERVPPTSPITITFSAPMDPTSTTAALRVTSSTVGVVGGSTEWTENNRVLVLRPQAPLPLGARIQVDVSDEAQALGDGAARLRRPHSHSFGVVPFPALSRTEPSDGAQNASLDDPVQFFFNAPILPETVQLSISPPISATQVYSFYNEYDSSFLVFFPRRPLTAYTLTLAAGIRDPYGNTITEPITLRFRTGERRPELLMVTPGVAGTYNAYTETAILFQTVNVNEINAVLYRLTPEQVAALDPTDDYERWRLYSPPANQLVRRWTIRPLGPRHERVVTREVLRHANGEPLGPGLYFLGADSPQVVYSEYDIKPRVILVVSRYHVAIKRGHEDVLVWVTDLATAQPVPDLPVTVFPWDGQPVSGRTGADGVFRVAVPASSEPWRSTEAFVGTAEDPGWASTAWNAGIGPWDYNLASDFLRLPYRIHVYTDRPLYRAGDTLHYRAIIRTDQDAVYDVPASLTVEAILRNPQGEIIYRRPQTTDAYGVVYDAIPLAAEAQLGFYSLEIKATETQSAWANVLVAAFRKPEFEVKATVTPTEVIAGQPAQATVQATYFFGGAVKRAAVRWALFRNPYGFTYDDGQPWSFTDFQPDEFVEPIILPFRETIASGTGVTDDEGRFRLDVPTELAAEPTRGSRGSETRVIEFAITDISDQEVAGNTSLVIHAAEVYPGVRPESYVGTVGSRQTAHFIAVAALSRRPQPGQRLEVTIGQMAWRTVRERGEDGILRFVTRVEAITVREEVVTTGDNGQARLDWTPTEPGQYLIRVTARDRLGNALRSAAFVWVAGPEYAAWPVRNNDRIDLVADKKLYRVGETARVLVPSPWAAPTTALITIERGGIFEHQVRVLATNSETLSIPIRPAYAPNVFVSVLLVAPPIGDEAPTFKLGLVQLGVDPEQHLLRLDINAEPSPARPGDTVTYRIRATDHQGRPARAQLSLALVDKALLSLYPDPGPGIVQTFWGARGLGVQTGVSLVASLNRLDEALRRGFKGGGGAEGALAQLDVRTDFRDLAYWQAAAETDAAGNLEVRITLPDNLTTWQMRAVAVDRATAVADITHDLPVRKPLFVRPVLPRFVVHDDRFQVGAIVQNQTGQSQEVVLTFDFSGLTALGQTRYTLTVADGEASRIDLPVQVDDIDPTSRLVLDEVTVRLRATAGAYGDALELRLPVRRYSSPETVATAGIVTAEEPRFEAITLPDRYDPTQGDLIVRVEPSLAAGMSGALSYLEHFPYECTEQLVSRFLPNLFTARALAKLGLERPELKARLDAQVAVALQRLYTRQNPDGGWGWFGQNASDPYTSAYVLFGLTAAREHGYAVDEAVMARAADFLRRQLRPPASLNGYAPRGEESPRPVASGQARVVALNRQAFFVYVLDRYAVSTGGQRPLAEAQLLYEERERMAAYARGYLALTLRAQASVAATADQARNLLDGLAGQAVLSATGAHWEETATDWWTMNTDTQTTAVVLAALVAVQPDHPLGPQVVRWLMSARNADRWQSTHETAWALIALTDWMAATGELQGAYAWSVALNGQNRGRGDVTPATVDQAQTLRVAIGELLADAINTLALERTPGPGRMYYSAYLRTFLPVPDLPPVSRGLTVARRYLRHGAETPTPITAAQVGEIIDVELTLVVPTTMHYLVVEDPIPAGTEPIDTSFATTPLTANDPTLQPQPEPGREPPWWFWLPAAFELKDDRVGLFATELLPGAYTFRYQLRASIAGEFNVLPPRGEMMYFPEVFGHGAGSRFTITRP